MIRAATHTDAASEVATIAPRAYSLAGRFTSRCMLAALKIIEEL